MTDTTAHKGATPMTDTTAHDLAGGPAPAGPPSPPTDSPPVLQVVPDIDPATGWPLDFDEYADPRLIESARVFEVDEHGASVHDTEPETGRAPAKPILPEWLGTKAGRRGQLGSWFDQGWRIAAYHAIRLPLYYARLVGRSPIGVGRLVSPLWRWTLDAPNVAALDALQATASDSPSAAARYAEAQKAHMHKIAVHIFADVALLIGTAVVLLAALAWSTIITVAAAPIVLGTIGRDRSKPLISRAVFAGNRPRRPDAKLITKALTHCGIGPLTSAIKEDPESVRYTGPAQRSGPGWRIDMDLPAGVTAGDVIDKRDKIASTLQRPLGCVWPEGDPDQHEGRLVLYVADAAMAAGGPLAWDLAKAGTTNVFQPIPIGIDTRGEPVSPVLMFASGIIGAIPRMGKSFTLRLLVLAMALDKRSRLYVYNLKGGADFNFARHVAHNYRSGDSEDDQRSALDDLTGLQDEMRRRYKLIERLALESPELCPEGKVTDQLASMTDLDLYPVGVFVDECQIWFAESDYAKEFEAVCIDLVKRGPAVGIMCWLATQRVDAASIPTGISANAVLRFCLKVLGQTENDMVLGTSMYKAGFRATAFGRRDLGIAYLAGEGADPLIVKTAFVDGKMAEAIALRAKAIREKSGWLTGLAAGDESIPEDLDTTTIVDHLAAVWPPDTKKLAYVDLADILADMLPDIYRGWTSDKVSSATKAHSLPSAPNCKGPDGKYSLKGIAIADVRAALDDRDGESGES